MFEFFTDALWSPYVAGAGIFAEIYPLVKTRVLRWGKFSAVTVPELLNLNLWIVLILMEGFMMGFCFCLNIMGCDPVDRTRCSFSDIDRRYKKHDLLPKKDTTFK